MNLGWDFWKFRPSDATIGRFFIVDPLGADFAHNSLYAFQENKFGKGVELEGAELKKFLDYSLGVAAGIAEDITLGGYKAGRGNEDYNLGVEGGHNASIAIGGGTAGFGTGVMVGSGALTVASGGTLTPATALTAAAGAALTTFGGAITAKALTSVNSEGSSSTGTRRQNRIPDSGKPNSILTNKSGTTTKKYGPDGNVQKEFNKGHQGKNTPKNERNDHIHDHKPKTDRHPNDPKPTERQPGRQPKKGELKRDFEI